MAEKRRGLGRGLGALIASGPVDPKPTEEKTSEAENAYSAAQAVSPDAKDNNTVGKGANTSQGAAGAEKATARRTPSKQSGASSKKTTAAKKSTERSSAGKTSADARVTRTDEQASPSASSPSSATPRRSRPSDMFFTSTVPAGNQQAAGVEPGKAASKRIDSNHRRSVPDVLGAAARRRSAASSTSAPSAQSSVSAVSAAEPAGSAEGESEGLVAVPGTTFAEIEIDQIHPNRKQPRQVFDEDELAELVISIKEVGLLQPIVVRTSHETGEPKYELVMGERRWRASQRADLSRIPAIIRETDDGDLLRDALLENLHRSQLNPLEEAAAYQQLMDEFACTQEELSDRIGRSRPQISNTIRLLRLPALVQRRVAAGVLSAGHARALLTVEDPESLEKLAQRVVNEGLSVRATEEAASLLRGEQPQTKKRRRPEPQRHERLDHMANSLQDRLDTNVKITLGARKGKVQIEFASVDDLERIMHLIGEQE
jgi:ParB family chromosome partitioning protein